MISVWDGTSLVAAHPTTIATTVFSGGAAAGSTGCNLYRFPYSIRDNSISFGDPVLSGSACDPSYVAQSNAFVQAMAASTGFSLSEETLEFTDSAGAVQLRFRPAVELPLAGVTWLATGYAGQRGGLVSPLDGTQISLAFRDDGTMVGIAGCNDYFADYEIDGAQVTIGTISRTEKACLEPGGVMAQEDDYLVALEATSSYATTLTGLELRDADGNVVVEFRFGGRTR